MKNLMPSSIALKPNLNFSLPRLGGHGRGLVGLDIQPGYIAAVQAHVNGGITVQHAAGAPLPPDALREGEVLDERTLSDALRELFADGRLGKRVRIGLANQRTVLRTLELPPVTDRKELAAAVRFQAEDQVPMPLAGAVLDFHSLGVFETPAGPRQRVIVVAAQREMVERLLRAVRHAGLRPEGVDLSAFALIRSLYRPAQAGAEGGEEQRVLYLNVGGLTNMAIAEGSICRFTRVVGGGLEAMAVEIAERRGIPLIDARALLAAFNLARPAAAVPVATAPVQAAAPQPIAAELPAPSAGDPSLAGEEGSVLPPVPEPVETWALAQGAGEQVPAVPAPHEVEAAQPDPVAATPMPAPAPPVPAAPAPGPRAGASDAEVRMVLENGIREIVGEVRNSLDFHRSQEGGGEVTSVVLSGPALEMAGFAEALEADLGMSVRRQSVGGVNGSVFASVSADRLAIATGLAAEEAPR
jgi:type IV pilus assembly protein PilM